MSTAMKPMRPSSPLLRALALGAALVLLAPACEEDDPCDATTTLDRGVCFPKAGPDAAPAADAAAPAASFGTPCTNPDHSECQGDVVDICLILPGKTVGYCSAKDCNLAPNVCPATGSYTCFDASAMVPGAPHVCVDLTKL